MLKKGGVVKLINTKVVQRSATESVTISRSGELIVFAPDTGRERERYKLPYGATVKVKEGEEIKGGGVVATWDPHTHPIITEIAGKIQFSGMEEGLSVTLQTDELTGLSNVTVMDINERPSAGKDLRPMISLVDKKGNPILLANKSPAHYILPNSSIVNVNDGDQVGIGEVIARIPQASSKNS